MTKLLWNLRGGNVTDGFTVFLLIVVIFLNVIPLVFGCVFLVLFLRERKKSRRAEKYLHLLRFLRENGRISAAEYNAATGAATPNDTSRVYVRNTTPSTIPGVVLKKEDTAQNLPSNSAVTTSFTASDVPSVSVASTAFNASSAVPCAPQGNPYATTQVRKQEKKNAGMSTGLVNTLMIVGVFFVILAGAVFATTTWTSMASQGRIAIVFSLSVIFFAASIVADRALKIRKTAVAFHVLGSFFLPLAILAVGYFHLLGSYLSFDGDGKYILGILGCVLSGTALWVGYLRYQYRVYAALALAFLSGTVGFFAQSLYLPTEYSMIIWYIYSILLVIWAKPLTAYVPKVPFRVRMDGILKIFAMLHISILPLLGLLTKTGLVSGLSLIVLSLFFTAPLMRRKDIFPGAYAGVVALTVGFLRLNLTENLALNIFLSVISLGLPLIASFLPLFSEKNRRSLRFASGILASAFLISYTLIVFFDVIDVGFIFAGVLLCCGFVGYNVFREKKNLFFSAVFAFGFARLSYSIVNLFTRDLLTGFIFASILCLLFYAAQLILRDRRITLFAATPVTNIIMTLEVFCAAIYMLFASKSDAFLPSPETGTILMSVVCLTFLFLSAVFIALRSPSTLEKSIWGFMTPGIFLIISIPLYVRTTSIEEAFPIITSFVAALLSGFALYSALTRRKKDFPYFLYGFRTSLICAFFSGMLVSFTLDTRIYTLLFMTMITLCLGLEAFLSAARGTERKSYLALFYLASTSVFINIMLAADIYMTKHIFADVLIIGSILAVILAAAFFIIRLLHLHVPQAFQKLPRVASVSLLFYSFSLVFAYITDPKPMSVYFFSALFVTGFSLAVMILDVKMFNHLGYIPLLLIYPLGLTFSRILTGSDFIAVATTTVSFTALLFAGCGRLFLPRYLFAGKTKTDKDLLSDFFTPAGIMGSVVLMLLFDRYAFFLAFVLLFAIFVMQIGKVKEGKARDVVLTFSGAFALMALWTQPFMNLPGEVVLKYYLFTLLLYLAFIRFVLFRKSTHVTGWILFVACSLSTILLLGEAVIARRIGDAFLLGVIAIAAIVIGYIRKYIRWFILGIATSVLLVLNMTWSFWSSLAWWIYLLLAGVILIGLAAGNEWAKIKGETLPARISRAIRQWRS